MPFHCLSLIPGLLYCLLLLPSCSPPAPADHASQANGAPRAASVELRGRLGETLSGRLSATDPDGDSLRYELLMRPTLGVAQLDPASGRLRYVPRSRRVGNDLFAYRAIDEHGNASKPASVRVIIRLPVDSR